MRSKSALAMISGLAALTLAATCGSALAMGHHGHRHGGDMHFAMLARAAGVSADTIHSTFKNDTQLRADFQNVMKARKSMDACIVAGGCNNGEIAAYTNAQSALTQQKLNDWQTIFAGAPNKGAATLLKSQLDALRQQQRQLVQQAFNSSKGGTTVTPSAPSQQ